MAYKPKKIDLNREKFEGAAWQALIFKLLSLFPEKNQKIIKRRFGLTTKGTLETLEAIGKDFGITRERVRQIEAATLNSLKESPRMKKLEPFEQFINSTIQSVGGVVEENKLLKDLLGEGYANPAFRNNVLFVLHLSPHFVNLPESNKFHSAWTTKRGFFKQSKEVIEKVKDILKSLDEPVNLDQLYQRVDNSSLDTSNLDKKIIQNYLRLSKDIAYNLYGDWGIASWSEINPKGVKDKAYIILKKEGKPLHFRRITKRINTSKLDGKKAHAPTVHNELIKDSRFVLVGRGIYALKEWGYRQGTVKDIVVDILKRSKKPVPRKRLVELVLKQRMVRRSTVLLNLQDRSLFERNEKGEVGLKS